MTQQTCLWWVDSPPPQSFLEKQLPEKSDVVVIGGGFTGTSAALQLAKGGANVVLLEAETIGWGASSRNGGQALSCLHDTLTEIINQHGRERAREMFHAAVKAADTVARIAREEGIKCDYTRNGNIEAANTPRHFDKLKKEQDTLAQVADFHVRIVPSQEVALELGTDFYHGLLINEGSGGLQPAKFVQGMALAADRAGAEIYEGTRVIGIERNVSHNGHKFTVQAERGTVHAKEVLLAVNAWTGQLVPHFQGRVLPAESFVIATEPLPEDLASRLIPNKRVVYDTKKLVAYYTLSRENRMVWGGEGTATGFSAKRNIQTLKRGMLRVFPELKDAAIDYFWSGTLGVTLEQNVHAGQVDNMWFSMCYEGHGVTLGTYLGEQMANAILGAESFNPFDGLNMPRVPFYNGKTWFVNLGKAWFSLLDMFEK
jgi:glycine/D-amino acid oxidase-like deaminating enzyme